MEENTSVYDLYNKRRDEASQAVKQSEDKLTNSKAQFNQYHNDYVTGKRNPLADIITKPQRDADREKRLKDVAKWSVIGDAIGLIGKGWASSKGVKPLPTEGKATFQALGKLEELDQLYRQEGYRYDQYRISEALRRQQAGDVLEQFKLASAEQDYKQNQQLLNNAQQNADAMTLRKEEQQRQDQRIKEDREYQSGVRRESYAQQDKANAREFNRQIELMNHKSSMSGSKSSKSDTLYTIKDSNGNTIPINASIETEIVAEAINRKMINEDDTLTKGDVKDSPQGRAKMQSLYQQLNKKRDFQGEINKMPEGVNRNVVQTLYDVGTGKLKSKLQDTSQIIPDLAAYLKSKGEKETSISRVRIMSEELNNISDKDIANMLMQNGINVIEQ